jgi:hypothetical protein
MFVMRFLVPLVVVAVAGCDTPTTGAASTPTTGSAPPVAARPAEQPRPEVTLASGQNHPFSLVVESGFAYWATDDEKSGDEESGTVHRVPTSGGLPITVASHEAGLISFNHEIAVNAGFAYWIRTEELPTKHGDFRKVIVAAPVSGGQPRTLATTSCSYRVTVDANGIFCMDDGDVNVVRLVPLSGGPEKALTSERSTSLGGGCCVLVDAQHLYWSSRSAVAEMGGSRIMSAPRKGGTPTALASFPASEAGGYHMPAVVDDGFIYVISQEHEGNGEPGNISLLPKTGGSLRILATVKRPQAIALDKDSVYFVAGDGAGVVGRISKATGGASIIATGQDDPRSVAVDDTYVYWANFGRGNSTGSIKKAKK